MSIVSLRAALESELNSMSPALATAWENDAYTPVTGTPYQRVYLLPAQPENIEFGSVYRENGIFQINLFYPLKTGTATAATRAELVRSVFKRGNSYTSGLVTVTVDSTPKIGRGVRDDDWWMVTVDIGYFAHIAT